MSIIRILVLIALIVGDFFCRESPPQPYVQTVFLSVEDVGVTDALVRVHLLIPDSLSTILIKRNGQAVLTARMGARTDTLLLDDSLAPNQTYIYKAYRTFQVPFDSSSALTVTTMDTTNHGYTFESIILGDRFFSILNDVCIVNDTCIWVVGTMHTEETDRYDSLGHWITPYNSAFWNGRIWERKRLLTNGRILYPGSIGDSLLFRSGEAIFAFGPNDIWIASGNVHHFDGVQWSQMRGEGAGSCTKIWGLASNQLWFVGGEGTIIYYDGVTWQKLNTGTTLDIQDIWGGRNERTNELEIFAVAGNYRLSNARKILRIQGTQITTESDRGILWPLNSLWFVPGKRYWVVGAGVYEKRRITSTFWEDKLDITTYTTNRIRGTAINDVFFCGSYGDVFHYNGVSWHSYRPQTGLSNGEYISLAVKQNLVVAVGYDPPHAVVTRGFLSGRR